MECGAGAFEDEEALDAGADGEAGGAGAGGFDVAGFGPVAEEGVRVGDAVEVDAGPAVGDDFDVGGVDVRVFGGEVGGDCGGEELRWGYGVLFGEY